MRSLVARRLQKACPYVPPTQREMLRAVREKKVYADQLKTQLFDGVLEATHNALTGKQSHTSLGRAIELYFASTQNSEQYRG